MDGGKKITISFINKNLGKPRLIIDGRVNTGLDYVLLKESASKQKIAVEY